MTEIDIAKLEIREKQCPMMIRRMYSGTVGEQWSVNELDVPYL